MSLSSISPFPQEVSPGFRDGRIRAQKVNTSALPHHSCAFTLPAIISGHQLCAPGLIFKPSAMIIGFEIRPKSLIDLVDLMDLMELIDLMNDMKRSVPMLIRTGCPSIATP